MQILDRSRSAQRDERVTLSLLVVLTAAVLTLQTPGATLGPNDILPRLEFPSPSEVMHLRPGGPPPGIDGDSTASEEIEHTSPVQRVDRAPVGGDKLRERPVRAGSAD